MGAERKFRVKTFSDVGGGGAAHKTWPVGLVDEMRVGRGWTGVRIEKFRRDGFVEWLARFASFAVNYTV